MPGKTRFGSGSLIGPVPPLPDEEEEPSPPLSLPTPADQGPDPTSGQPATATAQQAARTPPAEPGRSGRSGPPATLRLNEQAGAALWDAFVAAKQADPFLSYRQFASAVVLQGLHRQRP